ncbi:MAG TPA: HEAT repeat domain-containing protein [Gemmataceae bacterium]|nr:HEAT repeat domain-containing protein [Gemmataceae bacterium]
MADGTLKKLVRLIESAEDGEHRHAAILVAGFVGSAKEPELIKALLAALDAASDRRHAIEALGRLGADEALPRLVELVRQSGPELEIAAQAAGRMGARGAKAMARVMSEVAPSVRRRIVAALALGGTQSAVLATVHALTDADPGVVDAAARSLAAEVPTLSEAHRRALADELIEALDPKAEPRPAPASEAAMIRILGVLQEPRAEEIYWARLDPSHPKALRAAALQALGTFPVPASESKLARLLDCAADTDFQIVAPALMILRNVPVARKNVKHWQRLLQAHDVATRLFAVEKLREVDSEEVALALLPQLRHPDRKLREEALAALRGSTAGRQALLTALLDTTNPDEAWFLARAQAEAATELPQAERERLFERACTYQDADDRRAEPLLFLLRAADAEGTKARIEERAQALRKKRDYAHALAYLRLLTRAPACGSPLRFEQAALGLKLSGHDTSAVARNGDECLAQFARLVQDTDFDLLGAVGKAKWLDEEDLFYLGFHFAGENRQAKEFGKGVLELLIKRAPKSEHAKDARRKLKSEGLA